MILQLLKKDCIIAKNYVAAVILIGVGLPVLLVWKQPQMLEVFALPGAVFISSVAFKDTVSDPVIMFLVRRAECVDTTMLSFELTSSISSVSSSK